MRFFLYGLLALLPLIGLPLSAAECSCQHTETAGFGIHAVSCCQDLPADCCVQKDRDPGPKQPVHGLVQQSESIHVTLSPVARLSENRTPACPQIGAFSKRARPRPVASLRASQPHPVLVNLIL